MMRKFIVLGIMGFMLINIEAQFKEVKIDLDQNGKDLLNYYPKKDVFIIEAISPISKSMSDSTSLYFSLNEVDSDTIIIIDSSMVVQFAISVPVTKYSFKNDSVSIINLPEFGVALSKYKDNLSYKAAVFTGFSYSDKAIYVPLDIGVGVNNFMIHWWNDFKLSQGKFKANDYGIAFSFVSILNL